MFSGPLNRVHMTFTKPYGFEVESGNSKSKYTAKALNTVFKIYLVYIYIFQCVNLDYHLVCFASFRSADLFRS